MVRLNKIYTRTGDAGRTRLVTGETVGKASPRVAAYGETDELNAVLGLARLELKDEPVLDAILARTQNDLFDLGADLATPAGPADRSDLRIVPAQVTRLEAEIDALNADLEPLTSFVLPGGSRASAHLHLARTVCRRAERAASAFAEAEGGLGVHAEAVRYLNRLSDLLFVAARWANDRGRADVLWIPAGNR
ncbi:MAG: cob(I)yrinic acid a,c-diamide adenosyltransferase [Caulobacteraceae bacterium]|nr:cob(I)yrinic acid a,c-diamide adenosyltransferase [Caulobacteraceae bacterium]